MSKSTNIVKLSNGENLICDVVSDTDKHIEIEITTQDGNNI